MILSYSKLGSNGRLGNCLFEIASTIGIAKNNGMEAVFPEWKYEDYFCKPLPHGEMQKWVIKEIGFLHEELTLFESYDLDGYFQSRKYWQHCEDEIFEQFTFKPELIERLRKQNEVVFDKEVIAIHIRRGDYVGNKCYFQLPLNYYKAALDEYFPEWKRNYNVLIFSDDISWCKSNFSGSNIYLSGGQTPIEDMCLLSQCNHFILSNSSYSWWGAYLSKTDGIVVRPAQMFAGELSEHDTADYWIDSWISFDFNKVSV